MKTYRRINRLWLGAIVGLVLAFGALAGTKASQIGTMMKAGEKMVPPPTAVASAKVQEVVWGDRQAAVGSLVAARGVTLAAELPGLVREITFESGAWVRAGAPLVRLDTSTEEAQLAAADAEASLAQITLERSRELRQGDAIAQADLDAAEARATQAAAVVATLRATIAKKTIRAPFDGRISIRQVELGQILGPGTPVASLQSVSPIHAEFWLPQQALSRLRVGQRAHVTVDTFPGSTWDGAVTTINPEVDPSTRNVRVRATFDNPDGRLRPGMYAGVEVVGAEQRKVLVIPATAVIFAPYGDSVFVIVEKQLATGKAPVVRQEFVRLGERRGDFVAVTSGLSAGETVVAAGAFKLRNGMTVALNDALGSTPEFAPRPMDR